MNPMLSKCKLNWSYMRLVIGGAAFFASAICYAQQDPRIACVRELQNDPRFKSIAGKIPVAQIQDMKFQMLSDETLPNSQERKAIAELVDAHKQCIKVSETYRQRAYSLQINSILSESDNSMIAAAVDLYNRKLTFGKFNLLLQAIDTDARNKIAAATQQVKLRQEEEQAKRQSEQAERARQEAQQKANEAEQRRAEEARKEAQLRAEKVRIEQDAAARERMKTQCEFVYKQAYSQYYGPNANNCTGAYAITCMAITVSAAKDYAQSAYDACMAR